MNLAGSWIWSLDGWIVAAGVLAAVSASLLGNFLILRRMSMLGDAITHAILPGLAIAFFVSDSRSSWPMFVGAVLVGVLTAFFTEWIRGIGKVDEGASMGVVFTSLFALGLVLIVQAADHVDLDPDCVLYGAIELTPLDLVTVAGIDISRAVLILSIVTLINLAFVLLFYKELKLCSFDAALATTTGFHAGLIHYLLMTLVAVTAVASFESVGNILVVAMFVVPPAAAYLLTDRLPLMILLSAVIGSVAAVAGHLGALTIPAAFGFQSTTTAGMMAVSAGALLFLALMFAPRHGVLVKFVRQRLLSWQILADDVLALLYRIEERADETMADYRTLQSILLTGPLPLALVLRRLRQRGLVEQQGTTWHLTPDGQQNAVELVRSHRLWEYYLASHAGLEPDRLHAKAERYEHFTDPSLRAQLDVETQTPTTDPHGQPIPSEKTADPERPAG